MDMMIYEPGLELRFEDPEYQLTGVAISKEGRLFVCYPLWQGPHRYSLVEVVGNEVRPYPNEEMNNWKKGKDGKNKWVCVQAVYVDSQNSLWVVDPAAPQMNGVYRHSHKLVQFNLQTDQIQRTYYFDGVASDKSYINDVRVDRENGYAYLTNSNEGGIIVLNLKTGDSRQLLKGHFSVQSDPEYKLIMDGKELSKDGKPVKMHSDGIALSPDGEWLYFKPLTDNKLYRIRAEFLRDENVSDVEAKEWVEDLGPYATTDGMIFDRKGNLYLGELQSGTILKVDKELKMTKVLRDDRLIWPDSYSISDDGYLYISCSQIHKQPEYNDGQNKRTTPYAVYRMKFPQDGMNIEQLNS